MPVEMLDIRTGVEIEIYAKHVPEIAFQTDFNNYHVKLPPYKGRGLVKRRDGQIVFFDLVKEGQDYTPNNVVIPNLDPPLTADELVYTAHNLRISNSPEIKDTHPALQDPPVVVETLPEIVSGVVTYQAISLNILDPTLRVYFGGDFVVTNSRVKLSRYVRKPDKTFKEFPIWYGFITYVNFPDENKITLSTRQDMKRFDSKAVFGFESKVDQWRDRNDSKIPIVCATIIPYTIKVADHAPVFPYHYDPVAQEEDYRYAFAYRGRDHPEKDKKYQSDWLAFLKTWLDSMKPEWVTFDPGELVPSLISMNEHYDFLYERGIFFAPTEEDSPTRDVFGEEVGYFDVDDSNFVSCVGPDFGDRVPDLGYCGNQPLNIGSSYTNWCTILYRPTANDGYLRLDNEEAFTKPVLSFFDRYGNHANRYPHPYDSCLTAVSQYDADENTRIYQVAMYTYHGIHKFQKRMRWDDVSNIEFSWRYHSNVSVTPPLPNNDGLRKGRFASSTDNLPYHGVPTVRCKDLYLTTSEMKKLAPIPEKFHRYATDGFYEAGKKFEWNGTYSGFAGSNLRIMPMIPQREFYNNYQGAAEDGQFHTYPKTQYVASPHKGGAYYVTAVHGAIDIYDKGRQPTNESFDGLGNYDLSPRYNTELLKGMQAGGLFEGYYHHHYLWNRPVDLSSGYSYDRGKIPANNALSPSVFIYACVKNAGLTPKFKQINLDYLDKELNTYPMQLIADSDSTYGDLVRRVLPGLGLALKMDYESGEVDIVNLLDDPGEDIVRFDEDDIQVLNIDYSATDQYNTYIFENEDMIRGSNTLDDFRDLLKYQGKIVLYNDTPFIVARTKNINYGTLSCYAQKIVDRLSQRQDRYRFRVMNAVMYRDVDKPINVEIGDWVNITTERVPNASNSVDIQILYKSQAEQYQEFHGIAYTPI